MPIEHYIKLIRKHLLFFAIVVVITVVSSISFYFFNERTNPVKLSIFLTVSAVQDEKAYDAVQAATFFAETIQGWLQNPILRNEINENANANIDIKAYKQERQNMVIEGNVKNYEIALKASESIVKTLKKHVDIYNKKSHSKFEIIEQGTSIQDNELKSLFFIILASVFGGAFLGLFLIAGWDYIHKPVI